MRYAEWQDYALLEASCGERLERWGDVILIRPDPQVIWKTPKISHLWHDAHARYIRSSKGGGSWEIYKTIPESWQISYKNLKFNIKNMNFKHTGVFPEQASNWDFLNNIIENSNKKLKIMNLFAYTGGATLACANSGAEVCHVDASKGMVAWARENAKVSQLEHAPIRWIVDDCEKFISREIRRNSLYDGIIMDPPSYGRGPNGEIWKFEENIYDLLKLCEKILSNDACFFMINSYSTNISPGVMQYMLCEIFQKKLGGFVESNEIGILVENSGLILPAGSTSIWRR